MPIEEMESQYNVNIITGRILSGFIPLLRYIRVLLAYFSNYINLLVFSLQLNASPY